jgi:hypothetical protein
MAVPHEGEASTGYFDHGRANHFIGHYFDFFQDGHSKIGNDELRNFLHFKRRV